MEMGGSAVRSNMRSGSRFTSFLMVGLFLALAVLGFSYMKVSSSQKKMSNEFDLLQMDLRTVSAKHASEEKRAATATAQLSESEMKRKAAEQAREEKDNKVNELDSQVTQLKEQLTRTQAAADGAKKDANIFHMEKTSARGELDTVKKQLTDLQNAPKVCDTNACREPIRQVIGTLTKHIGKPALASALKENVEIMHIADDLIKLEEHGSRSG